MSRFAFGKIFRRNGYFYNILCKNYASRLFSARVPHKLNNTHTHFTNAIFASAAAIGLSLLISKKQDESCEVPEITETKQLNLPQDHLPYEEAIVICRDLLQRVKDEHGAPGMVIGVAIDGNVIWSEGFGYADVENRVSCYPDTVMRIASISKSITMAAVAKLWEQGKLDLDKPVQDYVPCFPIKSFEEKVVTITCRQLVSHLGGIRHYSKNLSAAKKAEVVNEKTKKNEYSEYEEHEFLIKDHFKDLKSSLDIFKDDPLIANPGSKYFYSTHGWTLISAIVEAASKEPFTSHIRNLFKSLGMFNTYLDVNDSLIYHRSRHYIKDKNGNLINAPYVDNSYKWAGGGFLSTVGDLLKFGNAMLYSLQYNPVLPQKNEDFENTMLHSLQHNPAGLPQRNENFRTEKIIKITNKKHSSSELSNEQMPLGYLNSKTVEALWTPVVSTKEKTYGMGWFVMPEVKECQFCESKMVVYHTGGAIGAASVLLILPESSKQTHNNSISLPKGIVVAILTNMQSVQLTKTALKIAQIFDKESKLS